MENCEDTNVSKLTQLINIRGIRLPQGASFVLVGLISPSGAWLTEKMAIASPALVKTFKENSGYKNCVEMNVDWLAEREKNKVEGKKAKAEGKKGPRFNHPATQIGKLYKAGGDPLRPPPFNG